MPIIVGSVSVDVIPNAKNFTNDLRGQIEGPVDAVGQEVGQNLSDAIIDHLADAIPEGLAAGVPESAEVGDAAGARFGDAFSTQIRTKIDAALRDLPTPEIDANTDPAMARIQEIKEDLLSLDGFIDIRGNEDEVLAQLGDIRTELEALSLSSTDIRVRTDAAATAAELDALIANIYGLDAAQQVLGASMAADIEESKAFANSIRDLSASLEAANIAADLEDEQRLAESMAADVEETKAFAAAIRDLSASLEAANLAEEETLAQAMAKDWEDVSKSTGDAGGSVGAFGIAMGVLAVVAAPVLGSIAAAAGVLVIGIKNAHVETGGLTTAWQGLEAEAGKEIQPGLQTAIDGLSRAIPELDPLVDMLATDIGDALAKAGTWLGSGGATEIVDYLKTEIPIVGGFFEALGGAVVGFINVTQGPANLLLGIFTGIANAAQTVEQLLGGKLPSSGGQSSGADFALGNDSVTVAGAKLPLPGGFILKDIGNDIGSHQPSGTPNGLGVSSNPKAAASPLTASQQALPSNVALHQLGAAPGQGPTLNAEALQQATSGLDANTLSANANAAAYQATVANYENAQVTAAQFAAQTAITTANMQAENNAAGLLQQALAGLGGDTLGVAQAETQFHASITAINTSLKTNGDTLDENTAAGQANLEAIQASVSAAQAHAQAIATQTGSTVQATTAYNDDITALKNQLAATGLSKTAIDNYVDSIDTIPPLKMTQLDIDDANATAVLAAFQNQINHLNTHVVVTSEAVERSDAAGYSSANGNFFQFYADGAHVAQMAPAGAMRVWAEPETGGESYIPHAASKRQRSEAILSETASLFGGAYIPKGARSFADGLVLRGSTSGGGGFAGAGGHEHPINVMLDGKKITKVVNEQNGWNGRY